MLRSRNDPARGVRHPLLPSMSTYFFSDVLACGGVGPHAS
jgi:hypothetical protein